MSTPTSPGPATATVGGDILGSSQYSRAQLGYLPPEAMSFSLALWWFAPGNAKDGRKPIAGALHPNQRGWFRSSLAALDDGKTDVGSQLGLPPRERWPKPLEVGSIVVPERPDLDDDEDGYDDDEAGYDDDDDSVEGHVFRVRSRVPWESPAKFKHEFFGVGVAGFALAANATSAGAFSLAFAVISTLWRTRLTDTCSSCYAALDGEDTRCPKCSGAIVGAIDELNQRLDAEERLELGRDD